MLVSFVLHFKINARGDTLLTLVCVCNVGSGCIAALEAEKWLGEQELDSVTVEAKKPANGVAPEYKSNPLL